MIWGWDLRICNNVTVVVVIFTVAENVLMWPVGIACALHVCCHNNYQQIHRMSDHLDTYYVVKTHIKCLKKLCEEEKKEAMLSMLRGLLTFNDDTQIFFEEINYMFLNCSCQHESKIEQVVGT
jgi:hypothetical protein